MADERISANHKKNKIRRFFSCFFTHIDKKLAEKAKGSTCCCSSDKREKTSCCS